MSYKWANRNWLLAAGCAQQLWLGGDLSCNSAHDFCTTLMNSNNQPDGITNLCDVLVKLQFPNPRNPCIIQAVELHDVPPGKKSCYKK